ncbi:RNA polymerase recycling motor HelD [Paenibacillus sp.]|uniref:RNA polymerase recycling motor HelD n=1 Tax=Paenibacillus sp. TaxID=58172 RepID=UPI002D591DD1|nr:RNA polymerase recycling motor HelD [Paenibacillus sp.]HZG85055.1 RNA polymerase recycling motor HelD [Paenibacillus sp.]
MPANELREYEKNRIERVRRIIAERMSRLEPELSGARESARDLRRRFWDDLSFNVGSAADRLETYAGMRQQSQLLAERDSTSARLSGALKTLAKQLEAPYFGAVTFREDGAADPETLYIGLASLLDEDGETFLVLDWRAPASTLFYDFEPGPAFYAAPDGDVRGTMERKLQFVFGGGELEGVFEAGVTIGDSLLGAMLAKTSDGAMRAIASTIQREQNRAIRNDDADVLIVHGPAGSGKTSAALQRAAYLLYKYRATLSSEQMLLFSPNAMFMGYVASVLPELGEEALRQETFPGYLERRLGSSFRLEHPLDALEALLNEPEEAAAERLAVSRVKSDPAFLAALTAFMDRLTAEELPFRAIRLEGRTLVDEQRMRELFLETGAKPWKTLSERFARFAKGVVRDLDACEAAERDREWVDERLETVDPETLRRAYKEVRKRQKGPEAVFNENELEERVLREMIVGERFDALRRRAKRLRCVDAAALYLRFLETYRSGDDAWRRGAERTAAAFADRRMPYEDAVPYLWLRDAMTGTPERRDIRHVLIDEAQDYSPLQLAYLRRLFPAARMTVVGDFRQTIFPHAASLRAASALDPAFDGASVAVVPFERTYRSTLDIVEFTRRLLPGGDGDYAPFDRRGAKPVLVLADDADSLAAAIARDVRALQTEGFPAAAIIAKTAAECDALYAALSPLIDGLERPERDAARLPRGVCLLPAALAKGVEFDAVLIADASARAYALERERKLFYAACTRAMHRLRLYAMGEPSPFVTGVDSSLYDVERAQRG